VVQQQLLLLQVQVAMQGCQVHLVPLQQLGHPHSGAGPQRLQQVCRVVGLAEGGPVQHQRQQEM
jgi:hypothetical protein